MQGAKLVLQDLATNETREGETQQVGSYGFVSLPLGKYKLTVSKAGFQTDVLNSVIVQAGRVTDVKVELKVGAATEQVVVEAGAFVDMGEVGLNPSADICAKNLNVIGIGGEDAAAYVPAMKLMAENLDRLPLAEIITHRLPLERAAEAVELSQQEGTMKVLLDPSA